MTTEEDVLRFLAGAPTSGAPVSAATEPPRDKPKYTIAERIALGLTNFSRGGDVGVEDFRLRTMRGLSGAVAGGARLIGADKTAHYADVARKSLQLDADKLYEDNADVLSTKAGIAGNIGTQLVLEGTKYAAGGAVLRGAARPVLGAAATRLGIATGTAAATEAAATGGRALTVTARVRRAANLAGTEIAKDALAVAPIDILSSASGAEDSAAGGYAMMSDALQAAAAAEGKEAKPLPGAGVARELAENPYSRAATEILFGVSADAVLRSALAPVRAGAGFVRGRRASIAEAAREAVEGVDPTAATGPLDAARIEMGQLPASDMTAEGIRAELAGQLDALARARFDEAELEGGSRLIERNAVEQEIQKALEKSRSALSEVDRIEAREDYERLLEEYRALEAAPSTPYSPLLPAGEEGQQRALAGRRTRESLAAAESAPAADTPLLTQQELVQQRLAAEAEQTVASVDATQQILRQQQEAQIIADQQAYAAARVAAEERLAKAAAQGKANQFQNGIYLRSMAAPAAYGAGEMLDDEDNEYRHTLSTVLKGAGAIGLLMAAKSLRPEIDDYAKNQWKRVVEKTGDRGNALARKLAREYEAANPELRVSGERDRAKKIDVPFAKRVADVYEKAVSTPDDPATIVAYRQLADETRRQYEHLVANGMKFDFVDDPAPYKNSAEMMLDVMQNKHMSVFKTPADAFHPLLTAEDNDMFRAVHDYFGHATEGNQFGPLGEENAFREHSAMFSPVARRAMATETRGQNSWVNYGPLGEANRADPANTTFAEQKVFLMPDELVFTGAPRGAAAEEGLRLAKRAASAATDMQPSGVPKGPRQSSLFNYAASDKPTAITARLLGPDKGFVTMQNAEELARLPGLRGEQNRIDEDKVAELVESMRAEGFRPADAVAVEVHPDGQAYIFEGNHRVRAAAELGIEVPTEVKFLGNSEHLPGAPFAEQGTAPPPSPRLQAAQTVAGTAAGVAAMVYPPNDDDPYATEGFPLLMAAGALVIPKKMKVRGKEMVPTVRAAQILTRASLDNIVHVAEHTKILKAANSAYGGTFEEQVQRLAKGLVKDVRAALSHPDPKVRTEGRTWYKEDIQRMDAAARAHWPTMEDPAHQTLFRALLAITSANSDPLLNMQKAATVYDNFLKTGEIDHFAPGVPGSIGSKDAQVKFKQLEEAWNELGPEGTEQWIMDHGRGFETRKGMKLFGPKTGPFFMNLMGDESYVTVDIWATRNARRNLGYMKVGPKEDALQIQSLRRQRDAGMENVPNNASAFVRDENGDIILDIDSNPTDVERKIVTEAMKRASEELGKGGEPMLPAEIQAATWYLEKFMYSEKGAPDSGLVGFAEALDRYVAKNAVGDVTRISDDLSILASKTETALGNRGAMSSIRVDRNGVVVGSMTSLDRDVNRAIAGDKQAQQDIRELYAANKEFREALRAEYGDRVQLYRAEFVDQSRRVEGKPTTYYSDRRFARGFGDPEKRTLVTRTVPVEQILHAGPASANGGVEFLVLSDDAMKAVGKSAKIPRKNPSGTKLYSTPVVPALQAATTRVGASAAVAGLGAVLAGSDNEKLRHTGEGMIGLAALSAIGTKNMGKASDRIATKLVEQLRNSDFGYAAILKTNPDRLIPEQVKAGLAAMKQTVAKGGARSAEYAKLAQELGPQGDRILSDILEGEQWEEATADELDAVMKVAGSVSAELTDWSLRKVEAGILDPRVFDEYHSGENRAHLPRKYAYWEALDALGDKRASQGGRKVRIEADKKRTLDEPMRLRRLETEEAQAALATEAAENRLGTLTAERQQLVTAKQRMSGVERDRAAVQIATYDKQLNELKSTLAKHRRTVETHADDMDRLQVEQYGKRVSLGEIREASYRIRQGIAKQARQVAAAEFLKLAKQTPGTLHPDYEARLDDFLAAKQMFESASTPDEYRAARDMLDEANKAMRDVASRFAGRPKGHYVALPDNKSLGALRGAVVTREVANAVNGIPEMRAIERWTRWWKKTHTVYNIGTHVGNTLSNPVAAHMGGLSLVEQPFYAAKAVKDMKAYGEATRALTESGDMNLNVVFMGDAAMAAEPKSKEALSALKGTTRPETAQVLEEVGIPDTPEGMKAAVIKMLKAGDARATRLYNHEDNLFRVMVYQKARKAGMSQQQAIEHVRNTLGDYHTNSPALRALSATVMPFVMYTAKVLPKVAKNVVDHPFRWLALASSWALLDMYSANQEGAIEDVDVPIRDRRGRLGYLMPGLTQLPFSGPGGDKVAFDVSRWTPFSSLTSGAVPGAAGSQISDNWPALLTPSGPVVDLAVRSYGLDPYTGEREVSERHGAPGVAKFALKTGASTALPSMLSWHLPKVMTDIENANYPAAATDALGFLGAKPRYIEKGANIRNSTFRMDMQLREAKQELNRAIKKVQGDSPAAMRKRQQLIEKYQSQVERVLDRYKDRVGANAGSVDDILGEDEAR